MFSILIIILILYIANPGSFYFTLFLFFIACLGAAIVSYSKTSDKKHRKTTPKKHAVTPTHSTPNKHTATPAHSTSYKSVPPTAYSVIFNDSPFSDNLNYKHYRYKARFVATNRMRNREIDSFSEMQACDEIRSLGYCDPIEITQIPFIPPSSDQIRTCQAHGTPIPGKACSVDMSYIIDKSIHHDSTPNPDLLRYATEMEIKLSYYIGKKALYNQIWNSLETRDKIAFFIFCIYRFVSDDRCANLNQSPHKAIFYEFASLKICDARFVKSMNSYSGDQLRYFGTIQVGTRLCRNGGSKGTIAYFDSTSFLKDHHLI